MKRPRILLADDHRMVAEGLKSLLAAEFELVGVVEDGRALVESAKKLRPDAIVADISMPHLNGIDALVQLKKDNPSVRVVFLTMHQDAVYACRARLRLARVRLCAETFGSSGTGHGHWRGTGWQDVYYSVADRRSSSGDET
jgi:CheY-like chemotaxis protein